MAQTYFINSFSSFFWA